MINEFGADSAVKPGRRGRIAGTTEVGGSEERVQKAGRTPARGGSVDAQDRLEKDIVGDGKSDWMTPEPRRSDDPGV